MYLFADIEMPTTVYAEILLPRKERIMKYLLLIVTLLICACASYTPQPDPMNTSLIVPFQSATSVNILNAQHQSELRIERFGGIPVNLQATTDATIKLLTEQLSLNGVVIDPAASKQLRLTVQELYQFPAPPPFTEICIVQAGLTTNNGIKQSYSVKNVSGIDIFHACNVALTKLVAEIMNDSDIRGFLGE